MSPDYATSPAALHASSKRFAFRRATGADPETLIETTIIAGRMTEGHAAGIGAFRWMTEAEF